MERTSKAKSYINGYCETYAEKTANLRGPTGMIHQGSFVVDYRHMTKCPRGRSRLQMPLESPLVGSQTRGHIVPIL